MPLLAIRLFRDFWITIYILHTLHKEKEKLAYTGIHVSGYW
jgi:hypothetical protein